MTDQKDRIFEQPWEGKGKFRFNEQVAQVFPDMIRRSIPGYDHFIALTGLIAKRYAQPNTAIYDLGCSLGATTLAMAENISVEGCIIHAIDNSKAMIERARNIAKNQLIHHLQISWTLDDITEIKINPASVIAMNFTLQFIAKDQRQFLLRRLFNALQPNGVLVLAEKVTHCENGIEAALTELQYDFKRANGYSDLEIDQKRQAIENVLIPETSAIHCHRLKECGFRNVVEFFHCLNFKAWIAVK